MSETPGEVYLDKAGISALFTMMAAGAAGLDEAGTGAPQTPDAGASTPLVGELLAGMSAVIGDLVTAVDVTAVSVRHSSETFGAADQDGARQFTALGD